MKTVILGLVAVLSLSLAPLHQASAQHEQAAGLSLWNKIYEVFSHPRCSNCHVGADNVPMWSGAHYGDKPRPHGMFVKGGDSRDGRDTIPCTTCHTHHNSPLMHGPPGAHVWALAPVEMEWFGKTSAEICAQIKDPQKTGGRSLTDVADHIGHDALVHWGWNPGPGREPAPHSKDEIVIAILMWDGFGAPCPE